jgi:hypothetical protein
MDSFARKPEAERQSIFEETANRMDVSTMVIEKDFWVCWTLKRLFAHSEIAPWLTFKGGTSLSKAYGLIDRFSEDIDLTISREAPYLATSPSPMEDGISGKELKRRTDAIKTSAAQFVNEHVLPLLLHSIEEALQSAYGWEVLPDPADSEQQTLLFRYPKTFDYAGYIQPQIKLEFGARGETEPHQPCLISPYIAKVFPALLPDAEIAVPTLSVERSFWEKVTILHALHHGATIRDRMSRHYYDTYRMIQGGIGEKALQQSDLLARVVRNKRLMFKDSKASYDTACFGSLKLLPKDTDIANLRNDFAGMQEMFMTEAPGFQDILDTLGAFEHKINQIKS